MLRYPIGAEPAAHLAEQMTGQMQAMSLSRPASLRQSHRRHNPRDSRVRFHVGSVTSQCPTAPDPLVPAGVPE